MAKKDVEVLSENEPTPVKPTISVGGLKAIEEWAKVKGTEEWLLAATKAAHKWGIGKEVSESEFAAALDKTLNLKMNPA